MVNAPDGVRLKIPLPDTVVPGDELHMGKGPDGAWTITKALRGSGPPRTAPTEWRSAEVMAAECAGAEAITVRFDTTKGPLLFRIVPSWAPIGVQRFLQLVKDGFYDDIGFYRGMQGGLLQFGCIKSTDPRTRYEKLQDDPLVGIPYAEGILSFAAAGPGTRKSTLCIMKADFRSQLGKGAVGSLSTETPIGMVCPESMAVMHSITCLGDIPQCGGKGADPGKIEQEGNEYLRREFPNCDYILGACL